MAEQDEKEQAYEWRCLALAMWEWPLRRVSAWNDIAMWVAYVQEVSWLESSPYVDSKGATVCRSAERPLTPGLAGLIYLKLVTLGSNQVY